MPASLLPTETECSDNPAWIRRLKRGKDLEAADVYGDLAWLKKRMAARCRRRGCRLAGLCSDECRHWRLTASKKEIEVSIRSAAQLFPQKPREWLGSKSKVWDCEVT